MKFSIKSGLSTPNYTWKSWHNQQQETFCYTTLAQPDVLGISVHHTSTTSNVKLLYW